MRTNNFLASMLLVALAASPAFAQPPPPLTPLPPPPQPAGNLVTTAKANLGKVLFWDEQLSSTRTVACGSCHQASRGGSDPRSVTGSTRAVHPGLDGITGTADDIIGSPGVVLNHADGSLQSSEMFSMHEQVTGRLAPSFINSGYAPVTFWDGRAGGTFIDPETGVTILPSGGALENQVLGPPLSSAEMGHVGRGWSDVTSRITASKPLALSTVVPSDLLAWINGRSYAELFGEAFGSATVSAARIAMAIASYERTLFSTQSPFDLLIAGTAALTPQENAGFQLFGRIGCAGCHAGSLMSDNRFHYIGVRPAAEDSGRMIVTHRVADLGAFRTPSLRNVGLRSSLMHNGRFSTLAQVVDFYDRGGDFNAPNKAPAIRPLNLTPVEKAQLIAFLTRALTDPRVASQSTPFDRPSLYSESAFVPQVLAGGIVGASGALPEPVALEPPLTGNPQFTVGVYGALGGASAVLVIDENEPPANGGIPAAGSFARVATLLAGSGAGDGFGSATLAIPDDSLLYGKELYGRWYVTDPAASGGVAASPAFRMQIFGPHGSGVALAVTPISAPRTLRLYAGHPNPFPSSTSLRFELFATSRVDLNVYDISGRTVRRLYERASAAPGNYAVTWDGRDDAGREVPGGMYFYRLDTDRGSETARVVRLQ